MRGIALVCLMLWGCAVMAEPVLRVAIQPMALDKATDLGEVDVGGVGKVRLSASRSNGQVVIRASGPARDLLGRAEATLGLMETPVYIKTPAGLKKITVIWGVSDGGGDTPKR